MKRTLVLAALLTLSPFTISFAQTAGAVQPVGKDMIAIYGHGNSKCSEYLDFAARGQETVSKNYQVWVNGFISAYNTLVSSTGNVARGKRSEDIMGWMTRYCQQNPNAYFQRATIELLRSMEAGEF
ncbi:MAG: hypothetical protein EYC62_06180 [Alphaproteobacteria bacterium]|nr:MAG: hypothetical protein EYC62_06180 [Alphaproteobacteria bacterium]